MLCHVRKLCTVPVSYILELYVCTFTLTLDVFTSWSHAVFTVCLVCVMKELYETVLCLCPCWDVTQMLSLTF